MATYETIAARVQALCNDQEVTVLTSTFLFPYVNSALEECTQRLRSAGVDRVELASTLDVPAGTTLISAVGTTPLLPTGFVTPSALYEKDDGADAATYLRMTGPGHLPDIDQQTSLVYWDWHGGSLKFVGATTARDVRVEYEADLTSFTGTTDTVEIAGLTNALSWLTAALVMIPRDVTTAAAFKQQGDRYVDLYINEQVKAKQPMPVRRLPMWLTGRNRF